ncbi:MAG: class I SAM-dependent methyltransferase [Deltaproteobacteria bacterium]|nr:class I SAM-dependent methyltransferase [Deltaproteobacteria bacterium]
MTQDKPMPNVAFRGMAFALRLMEPFKRSRERLTEAGLEKGQVVLEYGCGIGSYTIPAAQIVGGEGTVYALDIHPLAITSVNKRAAREKLANIKTILTDRNTSLPDESVDVILLYDTFHLVRDKHALLKELNRVLKPGGFLSADHMHTARDDFLETMQTGNLFSFKTQSGESLAMKVFTFRRIT